MAASAPPTPPLVKRPSPEFRLYDINFGNFPELAFSGDILTGVPTVTASLAPGFTGALPTIGVPFIVGTRVFFTIALGIDQTDYLINAAVSTAGGSTLVEQVTLQVRAGS